MLADAARIGLLAVGVTEETAGAGTDPTSGHNAMAQHFPFKASLLIVSPRAGAHAERWTTA
jgi:hypothetical protein